MEGISTHYLYPSALFLSKKPYLVSTVLGSCISVCLWDRVNKFGGMNHYMLPLWNGKGLASPKYGNIAIHELVKKMESLGSKRANFDAKIFGGGEVIQSNISQFNIGIRNIEVAKVILEELGINIRAESVGGKVGRKIIFNSATGEVRMKYVKKSFTST